jgi:hypothetical protein
MVVKTHGLKWQNQGEHMIQYQPGTITPLSSKPYWHFTKRQSFIKQRTTKANQIWGYWASLALFSPRHPAAMKEATGPR